MLRFLPGPLGAVGQPMKAACRPLLPQAALAAVTTTVFHETQPPYRVTTLLEVAQARPVKKFPVETIF